MDIANEHMVDELISQLNEEFKLGLDAPWVRSAWARGIEAPLDDDGAAASPVDRNAHAIRGVAVVTKGMAEGHNLVLDDAFLDSVVEAGNKSKSGIKARFDHPNASNTSMGTAIGRFRSFHRDGDVVRGDLHFLKTASKSPNGDYPGYLMALAEEDPQAFGTSIVFEDRPVQQLDEEGTPIKDAPMISRLQRLFAADVVDEPAANPNGFFSTPKQESFAKKLTSFLDRFLQSRGLDVRPVHPPEKESAMAKDDEITTSDPTKEPNSAVEVDIKVLRTQERERVSSIMKYGKAFGCDDSLLDQLVESDAAPFAALKAICDDAMKRNFVAKNTVLTITDEEANPSAGGPQDTPPKDETKEDELPIEEQCKRKWEREPNIRSEFGEYEIYEAYMRNQAQTKILRK